MLQTKLTKVPQPVVTMEVSFTLSGNNPFTEQLLNGLQKQLPSSSTHLYSTKHTHRHTF